MKKLFASSILLLISIAIVSTTTGAIKTQVSKEQHQNSLTVDNTIVEITRPKGGYIYILDHETIWWGFPFVTDPSGFEDFPAAILVGRPTITIHANVTSETAVDHISFKTVKDLPFPFQNRTIEEYEDFEKPYEYKFSQASLRNNVYKISVVAYDANENILGSDFILLASLKVYLIPFW